MRLRAYLVEISYRKANWTVLYASIEQLAAKHHSMLYSNAVQPATLESALGDAFPDANAALKRLPALDADLSGSTGIVAVSTAWRYGACLGTDGI